MNELEDRPYQCTVVGCWKRFRRKEHLQNHSFTHSGIKNHKCSHQDCTSSFVTIGQLRRHMEVHNKNLNPYICTVCNEAYSKKSKLREHRLTAHNIAEFLCTIGT